jgi:hypothetical protein
MFLLFVALLVAWPALLLAVLARWYIKQHSTNPALYWIGAGVLGALGALLLATRANPYPLFQLVIDDLVELALPKSPITFTHFLGDALPLWERSLLVFPWLTLLLELFGTTSLQTTLLTQERRRREIQTKKSQRAARKATNAPDQLNGNAVLGALIDNLNT